MFKRCKTHSRTLCTRCVWITLSFPIEHLIWERAPMFASVTHILGL
jgi:hypothetical protein